nr:hypothetical protein [uncultured Cellulosilyticum sp.]
MKVESLLDVKANGLSMTINLLETTRILVFLEQVIKGEYTIKEFSEAYKEYANKVQLIDIIERQRRSYTEITNILCGIIVEKALKEKKVISCQQINHINFLLDLGIIDLYNLLKIEENRENTEEEKGVISRRQIKELQMGNVILARLEQYGYIETGTVAYMYGTPGFSELYLDLIENITIGYSIKQLEQLVREELCND